MSESKASIPRPRTRRSPAASVSAIESLDFPDDDDTEMALFGHVELVDVSRRVVRAEPEQPDSGYGFNAFGVSQKVVLWHTSAKGAYWKSRVIALNAVQQTFTVQIYDTSETIQHVSSSCLWPGSRGPGGVPVQ